MKLKLIQALVRFILEHALEYKWSIQGFGMLRLYLPGPQEPRLNIWDSRFRVPNVSIIHTHPWDFNSLIVSGNMLNVRFVNRDKVCAGGLGPPREFNYSSITPGPRGGIRGEVRTINLAPYPGEFYTPGNFYHQESGEMHKSEPSDGCITINLRKRVGDDVALVFWEAGSSWVSAEPRDATAEEVREITRLALEKMI
jgi:hypothetical protein